MNLQWGSQFIDDFSWEERGSRNLFSVQGLVRLRWYVGKRSVFKDVFPVFDSSRSKMEPRGQPCGRATDLLIFYIGDEGTTKTERKTKSSR